MRTSSYPWRKSCPPSPWRTIRDPRRWPWGTIATITALVAMFVGIIVSMYYASYFAVEDAFREGLRTGYYRGRWDERREQEERGREDMYRLP